jgi:hypothetical protein
VLLGRDDPDLLDPLDVEERSHRHLQHGRVAEPLELLGPPTEPLRRARRENDRCDPHG